jgi:hypothetical protein
MAELLRPDLTIPEPDDLPSSDEDEPSCSGDIPSRERTLSDGSCAEEEEKLDSGNSDDEDECDQDEDEDEVSDSDSQKSTSFDGAPRSSSPLSTPGSSGVSRERLKWVLVHQYPSSMESQQVRAQIVDFFKSDLEKTGYNCAGVSSNHKDLGCWKFKNVSYISLQFLFYHLLP